MGERVRSLTPRHLCLHHVSVTSLPGAEVTCLLITRVDIHKGKYELRAAVKKLYQLRPQVSSSRVSVAFRVVNPKHDELHPAVSKELYQLHRKIWVYKMSNKWKVLTQFYCTLLYA